MSLYIYMCIIYMGIKGHIKIQKGFGRFGPRGVGCRV